MKDDESLDAHSQADKVNKDAQLSVYESSIISDSSFCSAQSNNLIMQSIKEALLAEKAKE